MSLLELTVGQLTWKTFIALENVTNTTFCQNHEMMINN